MRTNRLDVSISHVYFVWSPLVDSKLNNPHTFHIGYIDHSSVRVLSFFRDGVAVDAASYRSNNCESDLTIGLLFFRF